MAHTTRLSGGVTRRYKTQRRAKASGAWSPAIKTKTTPQQGVGLTLHGIAWHCMASHRMASHGLTCLVEVHEVKHSSCHQWLLGVDQRVQQPVHPLVHVQRGRAHGLRDTHTHKQTKPHE